MIFCYIYLQICRTPSSFRHSRHTACRLENQHLRAILLRRLRILHSYASLCSATTEATHARARFVYCVAVRLNFAHGTDCALGTRSTRLPSCFAHPCPSSFCLLRRSTTKLRSGYFSSMIKNRALFTLFNNFLFSLFILSSLYCPSDTGTTRE